MGFLVRDLGYDLLRDLLRVVLLNPLGMGLWLGVETFLSMSRLGVFYLLGVVLSAYFLEPE